MRISELVNCLETFAPLALQENYDNSGLIVGNASDECTGVLIALDVTEKVIEEAIEKKCNFLVTHHPVIFNGVKKLNDNTYVGRCVIAAIKNNIALYAIHTNLDNVIEGVNKKIAEKLGLKHCKVLLPMHNTLMKLVTFAPVDNTETIKNALFAAGAGRLGNYSECSFVSTGHGSFKANGSATPYVGKTGERHLENEAKIEVIFPAYAESKIVDSLKQSHPYEEVAYDVYKLQNYRNDVGSGLIGHLNDQIAEKEFLLKLKKEFRLTLIRHTTLLGRDISKVAVCGGAGSFLIPAAKAAAADIYITSDIKYHEFFDADNVIVIADIGHYESEQFTTDLIADILHQKFPNFAVQKTEMSTNPVHYFL